MIRYKKIKIKIGVIEKPSLSMFARAVLSPERILTQILTSWLSISTQVPPNGAMLKIENQDFPSYVL